jgi:DNA-binding transcriptional ArsR family regulator
LTHHECKDIFALVADDTRAVKALTHPLRLRLLDLLRYDGPATASELGRRLDESSGATSYHLRQLARHGFVEDAPGGHRRERRWRYRERPVVLPDDGRGRELLAQLLSREAHALDAYLASRTPGDAWDDASFFRSRALRLTPAELDALRQGVEALLAPLRAADAPDAPADARPVHVLSFGFPLPLEEP